MWGPYHAPTHDGMKYFLTIVDNCIHFMWTYLLEFKSNASLVLMMFITMVQTQFGKCIKQVRLDNAKELVVPQFLQEHGILHQFSCVERPEQNFIIERKHQHLLNVARALFFQSKVPI